MTRLTVVNESPAFNSYRAARVKSLFNATDGQATRFEITADLDLPPEWSIGVIVGPSGSGKTSLGRQLWDGDAFYENASWPADKPIIDAIDPGGDFDTVTGALSSAGLGDVPTWLRPYNVLSTGQQFRADLARILAERPDRVVFDEFTSVVDRQIARVGAGSFAKAWRRGPGQAVLLSCHYDILDWLEPDWVFDTATRNFATRPNDKESESRTWYNKPRIDVEVRMGGWDLWPLFKPHHYLDSGPMPMARVYVAFVDGEPVAHLGMGTKNVTVKGPRGRVNAVEARACRMVVMPEWQGAGIGTRFLNHVAQLQLDGKGVLPGRRMTTVFHTSHPGLAGYCRYSNKWRQVSASLYGGNRASSARSIAKSGSSSGRVGPGIGFGGHLRAVQGFRYYG